jgi:hypothetical protein
MLLVLVAFLLLSTCPVFAEDAPPSSLHQAALSHVSALEAAPRARRDTPRATHLTSMYMQFGMLQAVDAHSTIVALRAGATEANPLMGGVAKNAVALVGVKAASAASTIYFVEKLRKKNRVAAGVMMAAMNSAYALVVMHNARVAGGLEGR